MCLAFGEFSKDSEYYTLCIAVCTPTTIAAVKHTVSSNLPNYGARNVLYA